MESTFACVCYAQGLSSWKIGKTRSLQLGLGRLEGFVLSALGQLSRALRSPCRPRSKPGQVYSRSTCSNRVHVRAATTISLLRPSSRHSDLSHGQLRPTPCFRLDSQGGFGLVTEFLLDGVVWTFLEFA